MLHDNKKPLNQILYGPPGTGKTYNTINKAIEIIDNNFYQMHKESTTENRTALKNKFDELKNAGQIVFTTFHQSFRYEEFVEAISAETTEKENVKYAIKAGIFKKLCEKAQIEDNTSKNYILIIDEINRGNISKIFGEVITLIEDSKRIGKPEEIRVKLPYSADEFGVPENLYMIGTMNTADRSIAPIDTALRRRFVFEEMLPRPELLNNKIDGLHLNKMLTAINTRIEYLYDRDHTIGHAYLIGVKTLDELKFAFNNKIIPLLAEYFYEDWEHIDLVLNDNGFIAESKENSPYLSKVNSKVNGKKIYIITKSEGWTPQHFENIYRDAEKQIEQSYEVVTALNAN